MIKISNIRQYSELSSCNQYQTMLIESYTSNTYLELHKINNHTYDFFMSMDGGEFLLMERIFNMFGDEGINFKYYDKLQDI